MSQNSPFLFSAGGGQPGLSSQAQRQHPAQGSQAQNAGTMAPPPAQTSAFQQNNQLPAMDMSALANITPQQLVLIGHLFKTGALNLPELPTAAQPQVPARPNGASNAAVQGSAPQLRQGDIDMDKEDGELEEAENVEQIEEMVEVEMTAPAEEMVVDNYRDRDFLRPPPTGPRKRSASPRDKYGRVQGDGRTSLHDASPSANPAKARKISQPQPAMQNGKQAAPPRQNLQQPDINGKDRQTPKADKAKAARAFVLQLHKEGYSYDQICSAAGNPANFQKFWLECGLPLPVQPPRAAFTATNELSGNMKTAPIAPKPTVDVTQPAPMPPPVAAPRKPVPVSKPVPAQPVTANRQAYLAKLAAVRNKASAAVAPPPTAPEVPKAIPVRAEELKPTVPSSPQTGAKTTNGKATAQTELARKKLAELQAKQAEKARKPLPLEVTNAISSSVMHPAPQPTANNGMSLTALPSTGLGAGIANVTSRVDVQQPPAPSPFASSVAPMAPPPQTSFAPAIPPVATSLVNPFEPAPSMVSPFQTSFSPAPPTPNRPFSGLPGLFMWGPPTDLPSPSQQPQASAAPLPAEPITQTSAQPSVQPTAIVSSALEDTAASNTSHALPNALGKRQVAADLNESIATQPASGAAQQQLFGQSRSNSDSERLVIEVSDDEDEEEEEDQVEDTTPMRRPFRDVGPLSDFPPRTTFYASAPNSPAVPSPGGAVKLQKNIEELKRQIAEKQAKKLGGKATAKGTEAADAPSLPGLVTRPKSNGVGSPNGGTSSSSAATAAAARQLEKAALERRLKELEQERSRIAPATSSSPSKPPSAIEPVMSGALPREEDTDEPAPMPSVETADPAEAEDAEDRELYGEPVSAEEAVVELAVRSAGDQNMDSIDSQATIDATGATATGPRERDMVDDTPAGTQVAEDTITPPIPTTNKTGMLDVGSSTEKQDANDSHEPNGTASAIEDVNDLNELGTVDEQGAEGLNGLDEMDQDDLDVGNDAEDELDDDGLDQVDDSSAHLQGEATKMQDEIADPVEQVGTAISADDSTGTDNDAMDVDASDDDDEMYEPELAPDVLGDEDNAAVVELSDGTDSGATPANAIVLTSDTAAIDDDYAPELQPPTQSQTAEVNENYPSEVQPPTERQTAEADDDYAPELQPSLEQQTLVNDQAEVKNQIKFKPYQSPLAMFKDYRYHPDYLNSVSGGYRSMTYSNKINPDGILCPREANGEVCNDKDCDNEHFESMGLTDNDLLVVLGTHRTPAATPADEKRWRTGLDQLVKQLRATPSIRKDANAIAAKIVEYRREFIGDPTRTLNLGLRPE